LEFLDPAQLGQIIRAIAEPVIDVVSILAAISSGFLCSGTPTKMRARVAFHLQEMRLV